ncbi:thiamin biosynthesis protein ApbE [Syntrophotalea carbinolica DSM 2380]|uniref:FAD:protein FMN transferase n=1 Tax=Syntrophotalea carbinolica (strain DSM 2380 / NBRC 103641 / GraBd1) TaxID=338963 RepID=Q3A8J4_SYNC1|nr:FAD:protein FMN transferase [Syntrophotalea carbinolica]ABA87298.1 thiamin biosynthesis protein ApbE [Syntrophotalea carbinolica DSM 2380]
MSRYRLLAIVLLWFGVAAAFWHVLQDREQPLIRTRLLLGTVVEITVYDPHPQRYIEDVEAAFAEMASLQALTDGSRRDSDVAHLSESVGAVKVAPETLDILAEGVQVGQASGGAFDMTLGRLKALWGFGSAHPRRPSAEEIRAALVGTGPGMLVVDKGEVVKRSDARIDLGGIAKGYIIDRAVAVLEQAGVQCAAVNAGGDLRLIGRRAGPWRIGIRHPRQADALLATLVLPEPMAIVTSGDYERFFEQNGKRYHHLFDPDTGLPAERCQSVTVVSARAGLADALATAVFVLGPKAGLALLERYPRTWGLVVAADGSTLISPGLRERVAWP